MNEIKLKVKNIIETNSRVEFIIDDELSFVFKKNESFGIVYDKIPLITIQLRCVVLSYNDNPICVQTLIKMLIRILSFNEVEKQIILKNNKITIQLNDTIFISMFIDVDKFKMKITNKMFDINTLEELIMTDEDDKSINEKLESIYKIVNRLYNK